MAKLTSLTVLLVVCSLALAGLAAAHAGSSGSRTLTSKRKTVELDWRQPHALEIAVSLGDRLRLYWDWGEPTGVVQIEYPGHCTTNGVPLEPMATWSDSITAKGPGKKMKATEEGRVTLTFSAAGSFFLTSPVEGECDAKWLRVNVVA